MYKLYGKDGSEKTVETNTSRNEHIKSGFYSENKPDMIITEVEKESDKKESPRIFDIRNANSKPKKRKGI